MPEPEVPASQMADAESRTPEQILPFSMFSSPEDLYEHALAILSTVTPDQELVYKDVPPLVAQTVLDRLDSRSEGYFRINYNAVTSTIWIRAMPTPINVCHQSWVITQRGRWYRNGLITADEDDYLNVRMGTTISFVGGPYSTSRKEPDLLLRPDARPMPSLVMESGWSESLPRLQDDVNLWLIGSQGKVKATIILNWQRVLNTDTVRGRVELYTLDRNGVPRLQQNIIVFPAPPPSRAAAERLVLTRKDIFDDHVFQGQNPKDEFGFEIDLLRHKATEELMLMNLRPA
ncbi:hypothetical protein DTO271G3_8444 [Paecilomyces variotii]|nr:hypothetical protein DTO271G3_8444 [Paecilomyces variotii]